MREKVASPTGIMQLHCLPQELEALGERIIPFTSTQMPSSTPSKVRVLLLVGFFAIWFILSTDGAVGQGSDDHGNTIDSATSLALGSSVDGRIDPEDDQDVFRLDLSRQSSDTDVWIYATGNLDSFGELLSSKGAVIVSNDKSYFSGRFHAFNFRWTLSPDVYYVRVGGGPSENSDRRPTGDYTLHAQAVTEYPGGTTETATLIDLDSETPGMIEEKSDEDFFRLDVSEPMNLVIEAWAFDLYDGNEKGLPREDLDVEVLDRKGEVTPVNVRVYFFGFEIADEFDAGTYYIRVSTPDYIESHPVPYTIHAFEDTSYTAFLEDCEAESRSLDDTQTADPLYGCQWHLKNREGEDINIEAVWAEGLTGSGINVAVVDDGMDYLHEDLKANVDKARNHDYTDKGDIYHPYWHHGTNVAGIISAPDNNGAGVRGVAPRTTVYGYNVLVHPTNSNEADAMARGRDVTAVSNNSWGPLDGPSFGFATRIWEAAVETGIREGYGGKGVFYTWAAGNGHLEGDEANLDEYANYYGVTAVCAVDDEDIKSSYSETGANLWVCAPSSGGSRGILTTENSDRYYANFGGTSAATPIVSGVAALMREANPDLTWRDLKLILAASARKNDPDHPGWELGAFEYGAESIADRYQFNHEYGFGMVDAKAAVDLARGWVSLPPFKSLAVESDELNMDVPDSPASAESMTIESSLSLNTNIGFVEFVEINVTLNHDSFRDLGIELVSPTGTVSRLVGPFDTLNDDPYIAFVPVQGKLRFGSARHLGEDPNGEWKLRIRDHIPSKSGELTSWSVTFYGHESTPHPPIVDWITTGDESLAVGWLSPRRTGGSPVTAFDLRYSLASGDETVDSLWTVVEDAWTAQLGGKLEYTITGLVGEARYGVQVRAVNMVGEGRWSEELTATASASLCVTDGAVADAHNNPGLVSDCRTLLEAQEGFDNNRTLNWGTNTPISDWKGITVGGTPSRVVGLSLQNQGLTGEIPRQVGNLTRLEEMRLAQNALTGEIPTQVSKLVNLTELDLASNALTGLIPAELGKIVGLRKLDLSQNLLSGEMPDELRWLSNLIYLSLNENELSGEVPAWLGSPANLLSLFLAGNSFTGCIAEELGDLSVHDLDQLGIPFCGRGVLIALYNASGGANWETDTGWLSDKPISEWHGVTADYRGRVTSLRLSSNGLTGEIPTELGYLSRLQSLDLRKNQLTGETPTELGNLSKLQFLSISSNRLAREIPAELGNLTKLQSLSLSYNQLTGEIPTELGKLFELQDLYLRGNHLSGEIPKELANLYKLQSLNLNSNRLTGEIPTELGNLSKLQDLYLRGNQLTGEIPKELGSLSNLNTLYLNSNQLTGEIPTELGNLSALQSLYLGSNQLAGEIPTELANLSKLQSLNLNSNQLTGEIPSELGNLSKLETLGLGSNQLTGQIPIELVNLSELQSLSLIYNQLTGEIPKELGNLSKLESLVLYSNQLTGPIPSELGNLSKLETLGLSSNQLTGEIPTVLVNLSNLQSLYLSQNRFTGCIPEALRHVPTNDLQQLRLPFCLASPPEAPTISTTTPGIESLTITWNPPASDGRSVITAYDLRYVETAADETVDANWTVERDVWTTGSGVLKYNLTELTGDTQYDLQVRAVNAAGEGSWSATSTGTTRTLSDCITGGAVADSTNTGLVSDCEALLVARDNLAGSGATRSLNWASDTPLSQWYGVVLSGTPERVTQLRLHGQNGNPERGLSEAKLNGTIPPELGRLSELQVLYLHRNNLTGEVPGTLNSLSKLRLLYLYDNGLTGISDELGPGITELRRLFAQRNDLTGEIPSGLGSMINLDWLTLYSNQLTGEIPAELGGLTRLKRLYVHENGLTGEIPRELAGVSSLTHLLLHRNALTGKVPSELGGLTNLEWLSLYDNKLDGSIPSALGDLSSLEVLYLHGNDLEGAVPSELENLTALTNLWLKDNMLSGQLPEVLNNLTNLERVRISGNDFTGCIPTGLTDDDSGGRSSDAESLGLEVCTDS